MRFKDNCYFGAVKLTKKADPDKYWYSGYSIRFGTLSNFSINGEWSKNIIIFGVNNSSSVHTDNREKDILALGKRSASRLHRATITAEAKYSVIIT